MDNGISPVYLSAIFAISMVISLMALKKTPRTFLRLMIVPLVIKIVAVGGVTIFYLGLEFFRPYGSIILRAALLLNEASNILLLATVFSHILGIDLFESVRGFWERWKKRRSH